ncbi:hypothetical protein O4215_16060 [Rhodococcus maanshanensis]|uniref:hypothetical protein n=1 Tax=Rhodococcus maanshanensis TaxID=183556 RepID=UPI0022B4EB87|nr:hypothetical protein [Rhodococcus maanshanensis]MCZ4557085.1 hypothetical protein [Rhodococcus maanshanensis]
MSAPQQVQDVAAPRKRKSRVLSVLGVVVGVVVGYVVITPVIRGEDTPQPTVGESAAPRAANAGDRASAAQAALDAETHCEKAVAERLNSPVTPGFPEAHETSLAGLGHEVRGVVDSQDGSGASVRSTFECTVFPVGAGQFSVTVTELSEQ